MQIIIVMTTAATCITAVMAMTGLGAVAHHSSIMQIIIVMTIATTCITAVMPMAGGLGSVAPHCSTMLDIFTIRIATTSVTAVMAGGCGNSDCSSKVADDSAALQVFAGQRSVARAVWSLNLFAAGSANMAKNIICTPGVHNCLYDHP